MIEPVNLQLKQLRLSARPKLTIRKMAEELGIGFSRYSYFEDPKRFKKAALPLELTRQIADVLARYDVDPADVMKLAGLTDAEAEPEAREIEAAQPEVQFFTVQAVMPSEAARILARRLPTGFAAIGPAGGPPGLAEGPATDAPLPDPARSHRAPSRR